jgi:hypothetical protein
LILPLRGGLIGHIPVAGFIIYVLWLKFAHSDCIRLH